MIAKIINRSFDGNIKFVLIRIVTTALTLQSSSRTAETVIKAKKTMQPLKAESLKPAFDKKPPIWNKQICEVMAKKDIKPRECRRHSWPLDLVGKMRCFIDGIETFGRGLTMELTGAT